MTVGAIPLERNTGTLVQWAAVMLSLRVETCESILLGLPVLARHVDGRVLRYALRGRPLPPPDDYIEITLPMALAVAEAAPITMAGSQRRKALR